MVQNHINQPHDQVHQQVQQYLTQHRSTFEPISFMTLQECLLQELKFAVVSLQCQQVCVQDPTDYYRCVHRFRCYDAATQLHFDVTN